MDLNAANLELGFPQPDGSIQRVLQIDTLHIPRGRRLGVTGPSGAGKTTLIHALIGIQPLDSGTVSWGAHEVSAMGEAQRDRWRREHVGIIFQDFHLFPGMSILQNVVLPVTFGRSGHSRTQAESRARELIDRVGAPDPARSIETLSRGERQRVAIARSLLLEPAVLVADEPTANLDIGNALAVAELLDEIADELHSTLLVVSHDRTVLDRMDEAYHLKNGRLTGSEAV